MLTRTSLFTLIAAVAMAAGARAQTVFTQWNFDATGPVGPVDDQGFPTEAPFFAAGLIYNSPVPTIGNGVMTPLGMDNNYVFPYTPQTVGSVAYCDVSPQSGLGANPYTITCWRVRGPNNVYVAPGLNNGNGWNRSAPQKTQGAQFSTSTVNFTNIQFQCQISCSTQGVSTAQPQITTNGTTWTDFGPIIRMKSNDFLQPPSGVPSSTNYGVNLDFSAVPAVNNNPNFGVRIVSVYDPNFVGGTTGGVTVAAPNYSAASGAATGNTVPYNNTSGNWRIGLITFTGTSTGSINPVLRVSSDQTAVCAAISNDVTLRAFVQPGLTPASTGTTVVADLSSIGLSNNQQLTGNAAGTFFLFSGTVPANTVTFPGGQTQPVVRSIPMTVNDAQGRTATSSTQITFVNCLAGSSNSTVVISQVYGGGGNTDALNPSNQGVYDADFIELYNRSASAVSLNGWSVQYASPTSSGGFNNTTNQVNLSGTIQPQQYMLVRFSDPFRGFLPLPRPDFSAVYGFGGLGNNGGRVVLSSSTASVGTAYTGAAVRDIVGYGVTAITFEGAGPAPTPDNAHAIVRKSTAGDSHPGAQDTNQNFYDFDLAAPLPHNRASNGTSDFLTAYAAIPSTLADSVVNTNGACIGTSVLFTVAVTPGSASTGIAVSGDISPITGAPGTLQLFDDGPAGGHGDAAAGDNVFTRNYTIPAGAQVGLRSITLTATDAQSGSASSSLDLVIGNCVDSRTPVVISQVFGGGAHYSYVPNMDFAEIFNRGNAPVDLTGWNLQYADAGNDFSPTKVVALSGIIGSGERRIIAPQPVAGLGLPIPAPDYSAVLPGFGFDNRFGRVALVKPIVPATTAAILVATGAGSGVIDSRGLVDLVGYGTSTPTYEGVAPAGTLANGTLLVRKSSGAQDFNQNLIDFDVLYVLSTPRTTRTLTVSKVSSANGQGTVTSDVGGINCGAICGATLDRDAVVALTATPALRSKFTGWSGACSGTGPCMVTLADSATVTATFGCIADFNNSGAISVQDIFDFLTAWFSGNTAADVNNSGALSVQDIFDFLGFWFAGC